MKDFIKAGVIGHPVGHSKSPLIHNYWIEKYGLQGSYEAIDLAPADFGDGVRALVAKGYGGFNLTIPHKEAGLALCDEVEARAQVIGAVNTLVVRSGRVKGMNTDGFGFLENIRSAYPDFDFTRGPAVVLGAGGAARAIVQALGEAGAPKVILVNRTKNRAQQLAEKARIDSKIEVVDWEDRSKILSAAHLLVNTTSLGMKEQEALEIDLSAMPKEALVNDIVYAPLETALLQQAARQGLKTVSGIGMLLHQARPAFEAWFGVMPEVDEILIQKALA
ncbi:MAG: shikimate dehydrogenase [Alphaproteobacteria bacterium]|nr:shikimate dehydrogenase [Alphaproteobacteria bacterium]